MIAANAPSDLRHMSAAELEQVGRQSLDAQAIVAHHRRAPLTAGKVEAFLREPSCLRHPVRLVFEFGELAMHQFAQPE